MMMPVDQWECWKPAGNDFSSGNFHGSITNVMPGGMHGSMQGGFAVSYPMAPAPPGPPMQPQGFPEGMHGGPLPFNGGGPMFPADPAGPMGNSCPMPMPCGTMPAGPGPCMMPPPLQQQPPIGQFLNNAMPGGPPEDPGHLLQLKQQYEWQIQNKDQKLRDLQQRLNRQESQRAQMQSDFERDRQGLGRHLNQLIAAVESCGIVVDGQPEEGGAPSGSSGLNCKMEQLNSLLHHGQEKGSQEKGRSGKGSAFKGAAPIAKGGEKGAPKGGSSFSQSGKGGGATTSKGHRPAQSTKPRVRVTFPTEFVHTISPERKPEPPPLGVSAPSDDFEIERAARALEQRIGNRIDRQARQMVMSLYTNDALEALRRTEDIMRGEGEHPDHLSSVLQSVCRKIRRRLERDFPEYDRSHAPSASSRPSRHPSNTYPSSSQFGKGPAGESPGQYQGFDERSGSSRDPRDTPEYRHSGDMRDHRGLRDARDGRPQPPSAVGRRGPWSTARFEHLARQGGFSLDRDDDYSGFWSLKIRMQELEPPLTDEDMQVYCRWLHSRLHSIKQDLGLRSLRQLRADINFSKNGLTDDALSRLLQALQRLELHVVSLNLFANRISPVGARHLTDFLLESSSSVHEVLLSHNEIDDESALEMIRLLADHPKYQPRKSPNGSGELQHPVWLRLDHNQIEQPRKLLRVLENDLGITFCLARNRHTCGPNKCGWKGSNGFPFVHLYTFELQDMPKQGPSSSSMESPLRPDAASARKERRVPMQPLNDDIEENRIATEVAMKQEQFPGRSSVVATVLRQKVDSMGSPSETASTQIVASPSDCSPLQDDSDSSQGAESPSPTDEDLVKPSDGDGIIESPGTPRKNDAANTEATEGRPLPNSLGIRGVPEVTPEPDTPFEIRMRTMSKVTENSEEEEEAAAADEKELQKQLMMKAPPKILQRKRDSVDSGA